MKRYHNRQQRRRVPPKAHFIMVALVIYLQIQACSHQGLLALHATSAAGKRKRNICLKVDRP